MQALYFCRAIVCCVTVVLVCCVFVCVTGIDIAVLEFDVECGVGERINENTGDFSSGYPII